MNNLSDRYPILEYDPTREAMIEPARVNEPQDVPEHCVICFFREVIERVVTDYQAKVAVDNRWEDGPHPLYEIAHLGKGLAFFHPGVGAALSAALLEEVIAFGCRKFIVCGGCGVLEPDIAVGHLVILSGAVRDEGTSYHYIPPGREIRANPVGIAALEEAIGHSGAPYRIGKAWTTDAPYRETPAKITLRKAEGCAVVEMEAAALMAVAEYRGVKLGQVVYGGDDLSGSQWDRRGWHSRTEIRQALFWMAAEACLSM